ncbi:hypothetical protein ABZY93_15215 [Streptomyces smyrnaeus]|uniref:hypothetical protein n=1 Tax=Streptomyces smyrnaeus TaxID=1387713 RepID=UPI0033ADBC49
MTYEACGCVCHSEMESIRMWIYDREQTPMPAAGELRLLPWTTDTGKPCYLNGDPGSSLSRYADEIEEAQLDDGDQALKRMVSVLGGKPTADADDETALAAKETAVALSNVLRVADSRGARLSDNSAEGEITCLPEPRDQEDRGAEPTGR